ncbi:trigger factor [Desulfonatronum thiosulfatophilum]|uniref:Trigger factor n=1 Tax=Desulfonatronum thiosulfatophilum TaxID=617002 RepID=A0A1G6AYI1_9BACT|nr:trigger factor [Desulfonatronum thiosulfatophilum]SDB13329.1 trigger factor [Desulfonatronum thiosulfatophilum]
MQYEVLEPSSVKRTVKIVAPPEEVNSALAVAIALYRRDAEIKGFRKGKVPTSIIEGMFKKKIYDEATNDLINCHINEVMNELQVTPLSRIDVESELIVRDQPFEYTISFEVAPQFELPPYEGIAVEQEKAVASDAETDKVLERIRNNMVEIVPLEEDRPAQDGDVVVVDFQAFDQGKPIDEVKAENFQIELGQGGALPAFESMIQGLKAGQSDESEITFPADFLNEAFAGRTVTMNVTLKEIKQKKLPEYDAVFAKRAGEFESMDKLREAIQKSYMETRNQVNKSAAQKKILDVLTSQVDFELPESMVNDQIDRMVMEMKNRLERMGKNIEAMGMPMEQIREQFKAQAESLVKSQIFLLAVASKEGFRVSPAEQDAFFRDMAQKTGQDFQGLKHFHEQNNLMPAVTDRILSDKAIEFIYSKADVTEVEASVAQDQELSGEEKPAE